MYVRISIVRPIPSEHAQVTQVLGELTKFLASQEGYLGGLRLESEDRQMRAWPAGFPTGLLGRVTLWDTEAAADRSAETESVVSLRTSLNSLAVDHQEYAFYGTDIPPTSV